MRSGADDIYRWARGTTAPSITKYRHSQRCASCRVRMPGYGRPDSLGGDEHYGAWDVPGQRRDYALYFRICAQCWAPLDSDQRLSLLRSIVVRFAAVEQMDLF